MDLIAFFGVLIIFALVISFDSKLSLLLIPIALLVSILVMPSLQFGDYLNNIQLFEVPDPLHFSEPLAYNSALLSSFLFKGNSLIAHILVFYLPITLIISKKLNSCTSAYSKMSRFFINYILLLAYFSLFGAYRFFFGFFLSSSFFLYFSYDKPKTRRGVTIAFLLILLPAFFHYGAFLALLPFLISILLSGNSRSWDRNIKEHSFLSSLSLFRFSSLKYIKLSAIYFVISVPFLLYSIYTLAFNRLSPYLYSEAIINWTSLLSPSIISSLFLLSLGLLVLINSRSVYAQKSRMFFFLIILYIVAVVIFSANLTNPTVALGRLTNTFLLYVIYENILSRSHRRGAIQMHDIKRKVHHLSLSRSSLLAFFYIIVSAKLSFSIYNVYILGYS